MLRILGLSDEWVSYAWIAGPMSGTLVQPVIGVVSDACTSRWGRRRPFIVAGAVTTACSLLLFAYARPVGAALFGGDPQQRGGPLWVALFAFWVLDFSINVQQGPLRALLADVTPSHQIADATSWFSFMNGIGKTLGYGIGFATGSLDPEGGVKILYTIAAAIVLLTGAITVCGVREAPPRRRRATGGSGGSDSASAGRSRCKACCGNACAAIAKACRGLVLVPPLVRKTFFVQFWAFFAWFSTFIYVSDWVGRDVAGGDADAAKGSPERLLFESGVAKAQAGLCGMAALSTLLALAFPWAMARFGVRRTWAASLALMAVTLGATPLVAGSVTAACLLLVLLSLPLAATYVVPWALATSAAQGRIGAAAAGTDAALITATFNLSQCFPEFVMAVVGGPIVKEIGKGSISSVLFAGGMGAAIGVCGAWCLIPDVMPEAEEAPPPLLGDGEEVDGGAAGGGGDETDDYDKEERTRRASFEVAIV